MKVFKCAFTGKNVFTDAFQYQLVHDTYYEVHGKIIDDASTDENNNTDTLQRDVNNNDTELMSNLIIANNLEKVVPITSKEEFKARFIKYATKVVLRVKRDNPEREEIVKRGLKNLIKLIMSKYSNLKFYATEEDGHELDGIIVIHDQDEEGGDVGATCRIYVVKDGLMTEETGLWERSYLYSLLSEMDKKQEQESVSYQWN